MKALLVLALVLTSTLFVHAEWTTDYKAALATAKTQKKMVLLNFTGSDWCGACRLLDQQVFNQKSFQAFADKNYVLVTVDFPEDKQLPDNVKAQNDALNTKFNVDGFPTLLVVNPDGKEIGRTTGYKLGSGPDAVISRLKSLNK